MPDSRVRVICNAQRRLGHSGWTDTRSAAVGVCSGARVKFLPDDGGMTRTAYRALGSGLHPSNFFLSVVCAASVIAGAALADYRIRNDYGGFIHKYKLKYAAIRDRGERVIIDGSATPRAPWCSASCRSTGYASPRARASAF